MTISEQAASELAATAGPVAPEAAQRVLDYLIFHRSLLGESNEPRPELLQRYLALVRDMREGVHIVIADPFQKATAMLFELVMDEAFDPWEIDLARFTESYLERVRSDGGVDFAVAGRLLYMAWSILYLQSKELLQNRALPPPPLGAAEPGLDLLASDDSYLGALDTPEAVDVTTAVLGGGDPPLLQMVRHPETRPVSLLELVSAFGDAEQEARRSLRIQELRERLREEQRAAPEVLVHGDIPERDLEDAWDAALRHPVHEPFGLTTLWRRTDGRDRLVSLFLAVLFLARENVLELREERLGESPLLLVRTADVRPPRAAEVD